MIDTGEAMPIYQPKGRNFVAKQEEVKDMLENIYDKRDGQELDIHVTVTLRVWHIAERGVEDEE